MKTEQFDVTGMTCSACSAHVEKAVNALQGVEKAEVSLLLNQMKVAYDETQVRAGDICAAVEKAGYGAAPKEDGGKKAAQADDPLRMAQKQTDAMKLRLVVSFAFLIPLFYLSMGHMMGWPVPGIFHGTENALTLAFTELLLTLPILYVNRKYFQVGFKTLFRGAPNMDSLIALGSSAALLYGVFAIYQIGYGLGHADAARVHSYMMDLYFESAGMILALITLGKYLEARSKGKTGDAISRLLDLSPPTALVLREGEELEIPAEELVVGDVMLVKPGMSIPADGEVIEGVSSVDESAITGESIPVEKGPGSSLTAATINKSGFLQARAVRVGGDTTLSQIIRLVEEAGASKAPIAKLADKISGIFVPVVIGIAVLAAAVWLLLGEGFTFALSIGISVLVISCPCALGLATPVAIMVGTGKGAEQGILFKSAEALEQAHTIDTVVLDKTGTITEGKPQVTDILVADGVLEEEFLCMAASLEKSSEHPLADAVVQYARQKSAPTVPVKEFEAIFGKGATAMIGSHRYYAGNIGLMKEKGVDISEAGERPQQLAAQGKTPLYFSGERKLLGVIAVADVVKSSSPPAIRQLQKQKLEVVMLTGDNRATAEAIGAEVGVSRVISEVLPQDKERVISELQQAGHKVAMVGDGINDAPALVRADVGVAIGAGTDVAIESADVVLMKSDLADVATAFQLSKAVIRNIRENLFWAFFYNSVGIPLAAGVLYGAFALKLNPMFAAAAMSLSSVCVVTNALRLRLFKPKLEVQKPVGKAAPVLDAAALQNEIWEEETMKKTVYIEGMSCGHCTAHVETALKALPGVAEAKADLAQKCAVVTLHEDTADDILMNAVKEAGYEPLRVE